LLGLGAPGMSGTNVLMTVGFTDWAMATNFATGSAEITNYVGYTDAIGGDSIGNNSNSNVRLIVGGAGDLSLNAGVTAINSLAATTTAARTIGFAGQMLRMGQTAGILLTPTSGGLTLGSSANDGFLTAGGDANTAGELVFINNSVNALTVNSMVVSNGNAALSVTVNGNGAVNFYGSNAFNRAYINSGTVTFYSTNSMSSASPYTQRGGVVIFDAASTNTFAGGAVYVYGGTQIVNGPVNVVGNFSYLVGNSAGDRAVAVVSTNMNLYQLRVGDGASSAGAVYQYGGNVNANNGFYPGNATASGYGYYLLTNGSITAAAVELGAYGAAVMDMSGGTFNSAGRFSLARRAGGMGVLDLSGGRVSVAAANEVIIGMTDAATTYGVINVRGTGVLDAANGSSSKMLNLNVNNAVGGTGIVNLLSGGTIIANRVGATRQGMTVLNFNGGTLQAATNLTVGSTFMTNGLAGAYIYSGGVTINTDTNIITIGQSLFAPTGYGLTNIAFTYGGSGYIGAPLVYITGGSGTGATAIAQMDLVSGAITNIYITSAGSGYLSNDALNITLIGGGALQPAQLGTFSFGTNSVAGGLTKTGSGDLHLTGTNTYRGVTVLVEGTLVIYSRDNLPVGNTIQFSGGAFSPQGTATLDDYLLSGAFAFDVPLADTLQVNNSLTGPASTLTKLGEGLLVVTGNNDYGSGTFISNGLIRFNAPSNMPTTGLITLEAGSMVSLGTNSVNTGLAPYIGDRDFGAIGLLPTNATENAEDINFNNAGPGARVFTNLSFGAGSNLVYTGTYTPYQRDGSNFWRLAAFYGTTLTFSNSMTNYTEASTLEINKGGARGMVALTGTNTFSGGTFIGGGTLSILGDFALGAAPGAPATNITFQTSATLQFAASMNLDGNRAFSVPGGTGTFDTLANTVVIPGSIGGDGSMNKIGSGSLILNGNPSTLRVLTVNAGTMCLSNTVFTTTGINANGAVIVGDTTNDNNATLIVDTGSAMTSSGGTNNPFTVGNYGSGNTLIVTNGGAVYAGTTNYPGFWLGNQAVSSNNTAIIINDNSLLTSAGRILVGDDGSWNTMKILDGGKVSNAMYFTVGRVSTASNNLLVVSGTGALLTNTGNGILIGEAGSYNSAIITNEGRVMSTSRFILGFGATSDSNSVFVGGGNTLLRASASIVVGSNGSYNIMTVGNSASVTGGSTFVLGAVAGSEGNEARFSGTGTVATIASELRVGDGGGTNTMMILTGAVVNVASWVQIGRSAGGSSNILFISGEGACLSNTASANGIIVGNGGADNTLIVTNNARAIAPRLALGYAATGSNNVAIVGGSGTLLQIGASGIQVGTNGSYSTMWVGDSATVTNTGILQVGSVGFASNNTLVISDANTRFYNAGEVWLGYTDTHHNVMQILNGAVFTNNSFFLIGRRTGASNNTLVVNGASLYNGASALAVGGAGIGNVAIFTNGAFVMTPEFDVGRSTFATNNAAYITGAGTLLQVTGANGIRVGNGDAFNSLYIANSAAVTNAGALFVGFGAATSNNLLQITNAGSRLWVGGDATLGESAASAVTGNRMVLDSGATGVIRGNLTISTNSVLRNLGTAALYLGGHFDNLSTNVAQNNLNGTLVFDGGTTRTQLVEIASAYTIGMATTNFMVGTFQIGDSVSGSNAYVRLMDQRANSAGVGSEILAVSNLIVATGSSTLDLTNHTVFAFNALNAGTIQQTEAGAVGRLDIVNTFTNQGNLYATGGGILQFSNAFINSGNGLIGLVGGTLTNFIASGVLANLGTIGGGGLINPVVGNEPTGQIAATNTGAGGTLTLASGFTNSGTGSVNAGLLAALGGGAHLQVAQSFTNAGSIWLNNATAAFSVTDTASNLVNAASATIRGQGTINAFLDNAGTVSNGTGGALTFSLAVNNQAGGSVGAYGGSSILFNGAVTNSGTITARNGSQLQFNQGLTLAGSGSLALNPSTAIITGTLLLGSGGIITMANGNDVLVMRGDFVNGSTDTNNFNMRYGIMVFGGTTPFGAGAQTNTFEVASTNKGYYVFGFDKNMALGTLNITNHIEFVNNINNGGGLGTNECLYVDVLHLFNGATLKLSALTVYVGQQFIYEDGNGTKTYSLGQGGVIDQTFAQNENLVNLFLDSGGQIVFVPEPSTGALIGLGLAVLTGARRRKRNVS
jgi:autotransporter-associated beta strand protein